VARRIEGGSLTPPFSSPRHRASARYLFLVAATPRWEIRGSISFQTAANS